MGAATETEIKLRLQDPEAIDARLAGLGFRIVTSRIFESNAVFDDAGGGLRSRGCLLRLREAGDRAIVTFKGPAERSKHKSREELETTVGNPAVASTIFERLGFQPSFRYEKYRTEYERPGQHGIVTVDETPIGWFLELEGTGDWIDLTAEELGYREQDYLTQSYGSLYLSYCKERGMELDDMVFRSVD